jgi:hypothetical protein
VVVRSRVCWGGHDARCARTGRLSHDRTAGTKCPQGSYQQQLLRLLVLGQQLRSVSRRRGGREWGGRLLVVLLLRLLLLCLLLLCLLLLLLLLRLLLRRQLRLRRLVRLLSLVRMLRLALRRQLRLRRRHLQWQGAYTHVGGGCVGKWIFGACMRERALCGI